MEKTSPDIQIPEIALGVDIGTSHCRVAVWVWFENRYPEEQKPENEGPTAGIVKSQLSYEDKMQSGAALFNIKCPISRVDTDPAVHASKSLPFLVQTWGIGALPFIAALVNNIWRSTTPKNVLAIFLIEVRAMAEQELGCPVRNVVVTVPVSFSRFQCSRIDRVCAMAGLHIHRLMPEPTSVALFYAKQHLTFGPYRSNDDCVSEKLALIFNMGAGYCDVTITAILEGVSHKKSTIGSAIGGEDLLQNMMALFRVATQSAIHKISSEPSSGVHVDFGNGIRLSKVVERQKFEDVNRKVFERCESLIL